MRGDVPAERQGACDRTDDAEHEGGGVHKEPLGAFVLSGRFSKARLHLERSASPKPHPWTIRRRLAQTLAWSERGVAVFEHTLEPSWHAA